MPRVYKNEALEHLIANEAWLIEPSHGKQALAKYVSDLELLNSGAANLRDLYREKAEDKKKKRNYTDFVVITPTLYDKELTAIPHRYTNTTEEQKTPKNVIRQISFSGTMMKNDGLSTQGIQSVCDSFNEAYADESVSGVVFKLDTPGGAAQAADLLGMTIDNKNKPVVALVGNAYSGGAWATARADYVIGEGETAGFGSVGVVTQFADYQEAYAKEGIKLHTIYATKSKDKNRGYEEAIKGNYDFYIKNTLNPLAEMFINRMAAGRSALSLSDKEWQTGKTFMTKEAIRVGFCDEQGTLKTAILKCHELANSQNMEQEINNLQTSFITVLSANVETGEGALANQNKANQAMQQAYANALVASKLKDKEVEALQKENQSLQNALTEAKKGDSAKVTQLEDELATAKAANADLVQKDTHNAVVQQLADLQVKYDAQIAHTNQLIKDNNLKIEVANAEEEEQREDTDDLDTTPKTVEEVAIYNIQRFSGGKVNVKMAQKQ